MLIKEEKLLNAMDFWRAASIYYTDDSSPQKDFTGKWLYWKSYHLQGNKLKKTAGKQIGLQMNVDLIQYVPYFIYKGISSKKDM
jgi:hypothetical protein